MMSSAPDWKKHQWGTIQSHRQPNLAPSPVHVDNTSVASLSNVSNGWLNTNGLSAGTTHWWWTYWYGYEFDNGFDCQYVQEEETGSEPTEVTPHIDDITPDQGPIDSSVGISVGGSGFGSSPSVTVGGTGITTSIQDHSEASISVILNISADASAGNHSITVTANGKQSNSVNFFVQIPTKLRRDSISGLQDEQGGCGATRSLQYTLLDQETEAAPIDTNGTIAEGMSNYSGPSGVQPPAQTSRSMSHGVFPDSVGYNYSPGCPPAFTATFTQTFVVTLATQAARTQLVWAEQARAPNSWTLTSLNKRGCDQK
jgi:hypothetical protein